MNLKLCSKCLTNKPFSKFSKCKSRKDGHQSWCKGCMVGIIEAGHLDRINKFLHSEILSETRSR